MNRFFERTDEQTETERKHEQRLIRVMGCAAGFMRVCAAKRRLEACYVNAFSKNTVSNGQPEAVGSGISGITGQETGS